MKFETFIPEFKSIFKDELKDFINYKRSNGYIYDVGLCNYYKKLDNFFIEIDLTTKKINQDIVDQWMVKAEGRKSNTKGSYFSTILKFCKYLRIFNYENIIEPEGVNIKYRSNFIPYIYTNSEIKSLMKEINIKINEKPKQLKYKTFKVIFTLFYCCGLRHREALNIKVRHFDIISKKIIIENSKNNVSREIPLSDTVFNLLNTYVKNNNYETEEDYIFLNNNKTQMTIANDYYIWQEIKKNANLSLRYDGNYPRLHDLRHTFAINSLKQMEKKGFDLYTSLPILSTYLGHKSIVETEYFVRLIKGEYENLNNKIHNYTKEIYERKDNFYE